MGQISFDLYVDVAEGYAKSRNQLSFAEANMLSAVNAIVNVTTGVNPSLGGEGSDATAIELALLDPMNGTKLAVAEAAASSASYLAGVRALNDFVIANGSGTDPLANFINDVTNNQMWTGGGTVSPQIGESDEIPFHWDQLSTTAGYSTTNWVRIAAQPT